MPRSKKPLKQQAEEAIQKLLKQLADAEERVVDIRAQLASLGAILPANGAAQPAPRPAPVARLPEPEPEPEGEAGTLADGDEMGQGRWV